MCKDLESKNSSNLLCQQNAKVCNKAYMQIQIDMEKVERCKTNCHSFESKNYDTINRLYNKDIGKNEFPNHKNIIRHEIAEVLLQTIGCYTPLVFCFGELLCLFNFCTSLLQEYFLLFLEHFKCLHNRNMKDLKQNENRHRSNGNKKHSSMQLSRSILAGGNQLKVTNWLKSQSWIKGCHPNVMMQVSFISSLLLKKKASQVRLRLLKKKASLLSKQFSAILLL